MTQLANRARIRRGHPSAARYRWGVWCREPGVLSSFPPLAGVQRLASLGPWPTVAIRTSAQNITRTDVVGPLSLISNRAGRSHVALDGRRPQSLPQGCVALSPAGASFSLHYGARPADTFNIHFGDALVEGFSASSVDPLLGCPPAPLPAMPQIRQTSRPLAAALRTLDALSTAEASRLHRDEAMLEVLAAVLAEAHPTRPKTPEFSALRAATRNELVRRLNRAIDLMHIELDRPLQLARLAKCSALSTFHFARMFRAYTGHTPARYLAGVRLNRAATLLDGDRPLGAIAFAVGYGDASALSRAFRRHFGIPPSVARQRR